MPNVSGDGEYISFNTINVSASIPGVINFSPCISKHIRRITQIFRLLRHCYPALGQQGSAEIIAGDEAVIRCRCTVQALRWRSVCGSEGVVKTEEGVPWFGG